MYDRILVPLDGSKLAECVISHVESLARGCGAGEVILLRICEPPSILSDYPEGMPTGWNEHVSQVTSHMEKQCSLYLDNVEKDMKGAGLNVKTEVCLGKPVNEIVEYAEKNKVDLIVIASHGRSGASRWAYGSTADKAMRAACVPVCW